MTLTDCKQFLDFKVAQYNRAAFIASDPIQVPHRFSKKEDIEIAAFLTATIAWGQRKTILANARKMMHRLGDSPAEFIHNATENDLLALDGFVHRTFNAEDFNYFVRSLQNIYQHHGGLETVFSAHSTVESTQPAIHHFRKVFFELPHEKRTEKHVSDPMKNSAAKRLNMFLRWMVRQDRSGVDFGLWKSISPAALSCPLDVHSGRVARKLGLLNRKQNDAKALAELDKALREMNPEDPVSYDFALFGLGVFEGF